MDRYAFENQLSPLLEAAYRYAFRLSGNADDAKDLLQEATFDAWKGREQFQSGTNFKAWFFRILTNRFYRIRQRREVQTVLIDEAPDAFLYQQAKNMGRSALGDDPAADLFGQLETESVKMALDELPDEFREVALLYFIGDMSYEAIAETVNVPIGTVRSRLHRGRKLLQMKLWEFARDRGLVTGDARG
jgi:RNA polymerase sigma-70 factor (ECF subfamily)